MKNVWKLMLVLVVAVACLPNDDSLNLEEQLERELEEIQEYLNAQGINAEKSENNYYYQELSLNPDGRRTAEGNVLGIYYEIKTLQGRVIESYQPEDGDPKLFHAVANAVVPFAFYLGVFQMREGEVFRFFAPSNLAYGTYEYEDLIFPLESLEIEIHLVINRTESEHNDYENLLIWDYVDSLAEAWEIEEEEAFFNRLSSGLFFYKMRENEDEDAVNFRPGETVSVAYKGSFLDGNIFDESNEGSPLVFVAGDNRVISGFDEAVLRMKKDEKVMVILPSRLGYGPGVLVAPEEIVTNLVQQGSIPSFLRNIGPYSILIFEIESITL